MARRVDQVEHVGLAVARGVIEAHGLGLDGDAALALELHIVEHLLFHLTVGQAAGLLDEPVGERRLAVIDMGDDREISDFTGVYGHGRRRISPARRPAKAGCAAQRTALLALGDQIW